jgi:hypothetical protein
LQATACRGLEESDASQTEILRFAQNGRLKFIWLERYVSAYGVPSHDRSGLILVSKLTEINIAYFPAPIDVIKGDLYAVRRFLARDMYRYLLVRLSGVCAVK